jgi:hypothetical protein
MMILKYIFCCEIIETIYVLDLPTVMIGCFGLMPSLVPSFRHTLKIVQMQLDYIVYTIGIRVHYFKIKPNPIH